MVNEKYMKVLARLESAACSQKEKDAINMVRGRYVQQFGTDNAYVNALGMLEAVAATQKEKDDVNMIRGKYGLFEMTYGNRSADVDDDTDIEYENDIYTPEGEGGDPADRMMNEEERLSNQYGTPMRVVGDEVVRSIDKNQRDAEDDADAEEAEFYANQKALENYKAGRHNDDYKAEYRNINVNELLSNIKRSASSSPLDTLSDNLAACIEDGKQNYWISEWIDACGTSGLVHLSEKILQQMVKPCQLSILYKEPKTAPNGIRYIKPTKIDISFNCISLNRITDYEDKTVIIDKTLLDAIFKLYVNNSGKNNIISQMMINGESYKIKLDLRDYEDDYDAYEPNIVGTRNGRWNSTNLRARLHLVPADHQSEVIVLFGSNVDPHLVLANSQFRKMMDRTVEKLSKNRQTADTDDDRGVHMFPNRTREDAYTDFDEAHPDLDDVDPYSKYESVNKKGKRGLTEGVAYDEHGTLVDDDVDVPEVADTSDEYEPCPGCRKPIEEDGNREKMCRRIAKDTGYPLDAVREICWQVLNNNWLKSEEEAKRYGNGLRAYYTQRQVDKSLD